MWASVSCGVDGESCRSVAKKRKTECLESSRKKVSKHDDKLASSQRQDGLNWKVSQLVSMGFEEEVSRFSLQTCGFDIQRAIAFIMRQKNVADRAMAKKRDGGKRKQNKRSLHQTDRVVVKRKKNHTNETAEEKRKRLREKLFASHCKDLTKLFERLKRQDVYGHFLLPVTEDVDPEYAAHISNPMDFQTIGNKINNKDYIILNDVKFSKCHRIDWAKLRADLDLICNNAIEYNEFENVSGNVHKEALKLKKLVDEAVSNKEIKHREEIKALVTEEELDQLQCENKEPAVQREWRKQPFKPRKYEQIMTSEAARCLSEAEKTEVYEALQTSMNGPPPPDDKICSNNPSYKKAETLSWLIETDDGKGGKITRLKNPKGYTVDNVTLIEKDVWGIDCYTRKNIVLAIGNHLASEEEKTFFVEKVLLPHINMQASDVAWDMRVALNAISRNIHGNIEEKYVNAADAVVSAVNRWEDHNFRVHPKGKGIICVKEGGIRKDEFINEYQGEVYPAWQWNERENAIEMLAAKQVNKDVLPDFWNIQLERHVNDPGGHDVLTIDPSRCANFASRLSHSCKPNCQTICVAVNNRYMVAMYSIRPIRKGEELTFDYNAVTASEREFSLAACLCGSVNCRGSFLYLTKTSGYHEIIKKQHTPIQRFGMLVKACMKKTDHSNPAKDDGSGGIEDEDHEYDKKKIKSYEKA